MRIKLIIEYDGTNYSGWQRQANAKSIQQTIEDTIFILAGERVVVEGTGRTDKGVHALAQVGHFNTHKNIPAEKYTFALNALLPEDIRIKSSECVGELFHARYSAKGKTYIYKIHNARHSSPTLRLYHAHVNLPLDEQKMAQAAQYFVGRHDFAAFAASDRREGSTVRELSQCDVVREGEIITITVSGKGFLYNMVRIIAGTLIEVGRGLREADSIPATLESKDRKQAGVTAPANGLMLYRVFFD